MARCFVSGWLILVLAHLTVNAFNGNETNIAHIIRENEERMMKFSFRFSRNRHGRWVTQAQLQREGFPETGFVPEAQFSVEQSLDESTGLPHLVARVAASSLHDGELVVLETESSERFDLVVRKTDYFSANSDCRASGQKLAVPSDELFDWLAEMKAMCEELSINQIFVGINNLGNEGRFRTERGEMVMNGTKPLETDEKLCGVIKHSETGFNLAIEDCNVPRPYLCENEDPNNIKENIDLGKWLRNGQTDHDDSSNYETYYEYD